MPNDKTNVALTRAERRIVNALLAKGRRNQDIQALINTGRKATINSGRITGVKKNAAQAAATDDEVAFFEVRKRAYDPQTGLNRYDDERLIRAREAMILAVQLFNSAALKFKAEVFAVLANIAWTYLLHEFYERKGVRIIGDDGRSLLRSQMTERDDCPLSGLAFTTNDHTKAWKLFKVRPKQAAAQPENTDKRYCICHPAHNDYTYSIEWVNRLVEEATDADRLAAIRASKS